MRNFFTGAKLVSMAKVSSKNDGGGGGQSASGHQSGKLLSVYSNQEKIKNFEKFGTNLGLNRIPGVLIENGSVINGNGLLNFKLTPAILALRVCKLEGERRTVTCLGAKDFRWSKALSGGPEVAKQTGGLVKAHPVATVSSLSEGTLVKPISLRWSVFVGKRGELESCGAGECDECDGGFAGDCSDAGECDGGF